MSRADNRQNLPIGNPKPYLHNINAQTKFDENPLMLSYHPETKYGQTDVRLTNGR